MKIDERVSNYLGLLQSDASEAAVPTVTDSAASGDGVAPVAVNISSTAAQFAEDEARRERLNTIRQRLSEGSYNISGKDVADKMLNLLKG
jgi:flagellar biosynthesis anti-sigma factor FlgM